MGSQYKFYWLHRRTCSSHEKGLEEWMEPGLLGIALYLGPLFSLFDACLLISGCRLHCVSSGGHCLPRLVGPLSSVACKDCNTL